MCGVGGAGIFSDGILNLRPDVVGGDLIDYTNDETKAWQMIDEVDKSFLRFGAPAVVHGSNNEKIAQLTLKAASVGIKFVKIQQRHIGSENAPLLIKKFSDYLKENGVVFMTDRAVFDLIAENGQCRGVILQSGEKIFARRIIFAPGRVGAIWVSDIIKNTASKRVTHRLMLACALKCRQW